MWIYLPMKTVGTRVLDEFPITIGSPPDALIRVWLEFNCFVNILIRLQSAADMLLTTDRISVGKFALTFPNEISASNYWKRRFPSRQPSRHVRPRRKRIKPLRTFRKREGIICLEIFISFLLRFNSLGYRRYHPVHPPMGGKHFRFQSDSVNHRKLWRGHLTLRFVFLSPLGDIAGQREPQMGDPDSSHTQN